MTPRGFGSSVGWNLIADWFTATVATALTRWIYFVFADYWKWVIFCLIVSVTFVVIVIFAITDFIIEVITIVIIIIAITAIIIAIIIKVIAIIAFI